MRQIPKHLYVVFAKALRQGGVDAHEVNDYAKWLRYYFDFCAKYEHPPRDKESLQFFLHELAEKQQSDQQQKQAAHWDTAMCERQ